MVYYERTKLGGLSLRIEQVFMDIRYKDILVMKKGHPCGGNEMFVIRAGMDFKLRCMKCSHEFSVPRNKIEKNIKKVIRSLDEP